MFADRDEVIVIGIKNRIGMLNLYSFSTNTIEKRYKFTSPQSYG